MKARHPRFLVVASLSAAMAGCSKPAPIVLRPVAAMRPTRPARPAPLQPQARADAAATCGQLSLEASDQSEKEKLFRAFTYEESAGPRPPPPGPVANAGVPCAVPRP